MINRLIQVLSLTAFTLITVGCSNPSKRTLSSEHAHGLIADIETICIEVPLKYVYFTVRFNHWSETCDRAKLEATQITDKNEWLAVLERMIDDLYDPHISLNTNNQESPRLIPSGSDLWIDLRGVNYVVTAIRPNSGAAKADLRIGDELIRFNGMTPEKLALTRIHAGRTAVSQNRVTWAINASVAGRRSEPRNIEIRRGNELLSFALETPEVSLREEPVTHRLVSEHIGYIRFNDSLGNSTTVSMFDRTLESLRDTEGLIVDLRKTAGGGNTDVAEPILGRFIEQEMAYQRTVPLNGTPTNRMVKPSGPWAYTKPVVVLVGRWTGSMGEGMAIGFDGMARGKVMGSQMGRLAGGTEPIQLKESEMSLWLPTYDLHHIDGTPRHQWQPTQVVIADNGSGTDTLLHSAILELQ